MSGARPPLPSGLNVHVYPSPFEYETRILKVTQTLVACSIAHRVLVIATAKAGLPERQNIDDARTVLRVGTTLNGDRLWAKAAMFVEWSVRVFARLRDQPVTMVNCHSLSVLPLCVVLKWWHKAVLVYEPHELETETATSTGMRRRVAKWVERALIGQARGVIVVSQSIAGHYRRDYGLAEVPVILNVPETTIGDVAAPAINFHRIFGIPADQLVFMYQGVLSKSRGVHILLDAFRLVGGGRHLVLIGFGPLESQARSVAAATDNIHLHPPVVPKEIMRHTRGADVGFTLLSGDCINHECALPNKLFHYLHAGLPVIVSDLEEMGALVDRYDCGWRVAYDSTSIARLVSRIDADLVASHRVGALRAMADLTWSREAAKLTSIYAGLRVPDETRLDVTHSPGSISETIH